MSAIVLRGDAAHLPLPDGSVDLIVTSPPYFGLRSYADGGEHYSGQIGSEATPREFLDALLACTRDWIRALKPGGSIFVNLGDSYYSAKGNPGPNGADPKQRARRGWARAVDQPGLGLPRKTLIGVPWRYAIGCMDDLGLTLRAEIIWDKPNGLPESVTDRVRRSHEQVFHFTRQPRYYASVDEIREPHQPQSMARTKRRYDAGDLFSVGTPNTLDPAQFCNPLGKLPGSVWGIPSAPLTVPAHLGLDHFAAYPPELCRRIILGWSPPGICTECGEGRRPVSDAVKHPTRPIGAQQVGTRMVARGPGGETRSNVGNVETLRTITGYACACTPYTDHRGTGEPSGPYGRHADAVAAGTYENVGSGWGGKGGLGDRPRVGPWREYHLDRWVPPPTRPAVVVDPFGGTGTTALVADVLGRTGITVDRSMDYARLAKWRTSDPGERARALGVPKPPKQIDLQGDLFEETA